MSKTGLVKGDRVTWIDGEQSGSGHVFWYGQSKRGDGMRVGLTDEHGTTRWLDAARVAKVEPAAAKGASPEISSAPRTSSTPKLPKKASGECSPMSSRALLDPPSATALGGAAMPALERLDLAHVSFGPGAVAALTRGAGLTTLQTLSLREGTFDEDPAEVVSALASARFASRLHTLELGGTPLKAIGVRALLGGMLSELRALGLARSLLDDKAAAELACAPLPLTALILASNRIKTAGVAALAKASFAPSLNRLELSHNALGTPGWRTLLTSDRLSGLRTLGLRSTGGTDAALPALRKSPLPRELTRLDLRDNRFSDKLVAALVASEPKGLTHLDVSGTSLSPSGVAALREAFPTTHIEARSLR